MIYLSSLALFFVLSFFISLVQAVPPPPGFPQPERPSCYVNTEAAKERSAVRARFAPGPAAQISATTKKLAVLRVDFSDQVMSTTTLNTQNLFSSVRAFYAENSYNLFTVTATVSTGGSGGQGAYRLDNTMDYYANGLNSLYTQLVSDAVSKADAAGFDFSSYDHVMIYHAGEGAETASTASNYIWSVFISLSFTADGKTFSGATVVPESEFNSSGTTTGTRISALGVICHEYGHQLGLPDLYNTTTGLPVVGTWSLMDNGIYIGSPLGSNPAHLDAWSKLYLGFSSPSTISYSVGESRSLSQAELTSTAFIRLPISVSDVGGDNEYFLLEYRRTSGATYDTSLPGSGLLVWHVDDSIASSSSRISANTVNTNSSRLGVELIEADGTDTSVSPYGDSTDPWTSVSGNFTSPDSNAYNGSESDITVSNITGAGTSSMSFTVATTLSNVAISEATDSGTLVITGGTNGYVNPNDSEKALFGIRPSSSGEIKIKVYTLNGVLVWETTINGTANSQTVVDWDATNLSNTTVASGIYVVHVKGGGLDISKKVAIVK
jgi:M6 family metalloprotease-like protein